MKTELTSQDIKAYIREALENEDYTEDQTRILINEIFDEVEANATFDPDKALQYHVSIDDDIWYEIIQSHQFYED